MIFLKNEFLTVKINSLGAEVVSVLSNNNFEYIWQADPNIWKRHAPILFPIVGKLQENKYKYNNIEYNMNQHGFARDSMFTVLEQENNFVSLMFNSSEQTKENYPFDFSLVIDYKLINESLSVSYKIVNTGDEKMFYQIGAHPGFNINSDKTYSIQLTQPKFKYEIENSNIKNKFEFNESDFVVNNDTFKNDALIYEFEEEEKTVTIYENDLKYITMHFDDFKLLGIWSANTTNPEFICLEPWNGIADFVEKENNELKNKEFINELEVDGCEQLAYTIVFKGEK